MTADLLTPGAAPVPYGQIAPRYDRLHARWLRAAGGEAQAALEAAVRARLRPGDRLLDAGAGTGRFARRLMAERADLRVSLLDASVEMLAQAGDMAVDWREGQLEALPYEDGSFDLVTAAWSVEAARYPSRALGELVRVLRPGGALVVAYCAERDDQGALARLMTAAVRMRGTGRFLAPGHVRLVLEQAGCHCLCLPCGGPAAAMLAVKAA